jgi:hypothetical protein
MAAPMNTCTTIEQRGVVRFLWAKNMEAKDIHIQEMLPYHMGSISCMWISFASIFFARPQKTHNATLFYRGTCIHGRRHLVTVATSVESCAHRSLCVTIKLDSAAI